ncbi:uncharacterized protein [Centruroides vittatus]|uniref:uncharacterized protein n=1 Tax=Centruroides vittatus TaxID=120091 RepID=UPI00350F9BC6
MRAEEPSVPDKDHLEVSREKLTFIRQTAEKYMGDNPNSKFGTKINSNRLLELFDEMIKVFNNTYQSKDTQIAELSNKLDLLLEKNSGRLTVPTYAEKTHPVTGPPASTISVVIIESSVKKEDAEAIKTKLKNTLDPRNLKLGIKQVSGCILWPHHINYEDYKTNVTLTHSRHPATPLSHAGGIKTDPNVQIYTDGSKTDVNIGSGFVAFSNGIEIHTAQFRLGEHCSVFQAELFATAKAINWSNRNFTSNKIIIITDSASAMTLLRNRSSHPITVDIYEAAINSTNNVFLNWTRAHQGTYGNERADTIAKLASNNNALPISYKKYNNKTIKSILWEDLFASWQNVWSHKSSVTSDFIPNIKEFAKYKWYIPGHHISQFLSNHGRFYAYLDRFKHTSNPHCSTCGIPDSNIHYLLQCPYAGV